MARDGLCFELAALGRKLRDQSGDEINEDTGKVDSALMIGIRAVKRMEIKAALSGNMAAIKEISDRLDGKTHQHLEHTGADGKPLDTHWTIEIVDPKHADDSGST